VRVKLLFFAAIRDLVGKDEAEIVLAENSCTIHELAARLEAEWEPLRGRMASVRLAKNEELAVANDVVSDGDVIALIPPVAGG
jgi:sulfur-carrier protein